MASKVSWSWGAFFATFAWLLRSKLYLWAFVYFFVSSPVLLLVAQEVSGEEGCAGALNPLASPYAHLFVLALIALGWIVPALFADRLHAHHLRKKGQSSPSDSKGAWSAALGLQTLMALFWLVRGDYSNIVYREIVMQGESPTATLQLELDRYFQDHGKLPATIEEISRTPPDGSVSRVTLEADGAIRSVFTEGARKLAGLSFTMVPVLTTHSLHWVCRSDIPNACLPGSCKFAESKFWYQADAAREKEAYEAYLRHYPKGENAERALAMLKRLDEDDARKKELASALAMARSTNLARKMIAGKTFKDCPHCPEMMVVPVGSFEMGTPSEPGRFSEEGPRHRVTIVYPLAVGRYEITRGEFAEFVSDAKYAPSDQCSTLEGAPFQMRSGRSWRNPGFAQDGTHPALCVSWEDAQAYAMWLTKRTGKPYRLLTESEWEYAARAGSDDDGNPDDLCKQANVGDRTLAALAENSFLKYNADCTDGYAYSAPVGSFPPNRFGLFDMIGNAREWVEDCQHYGYDRAPTDGSAWLRDGNCTKRMARGGSWIHGPTINRAGQRLEDDPASRSSLAGLRVGMGLNP